jgi:hypothetical protein
VLDPANKDKATQLLVKGMNVPPDIAAATFGVVTDKTEGFARDGKFDLEGFKNVLKFRAANDIGSPTAPEKYLDLSYYQRALNGL